MDYEQQIYALSAETLALQHVLSAVLSELKLVSPEIVAAVRRGFDKAASQTEDFAIQAGKAVPPEHLVKALRIVEELRTASLGRDSKPKGIV